MILLLIVLADEGLGTNLQASDIEILIEYVQEVIRRDPEDRIFFATAHGGWNF